MTGDRTISVLRARVASTIVLASICLAVGLVAAPGGSAANRSCGTVTQSPGVKYRTTILKGSPPCVQVRETIRHYAYPKSSYNWCGGARTCNVGVYAHHWKCGALDHGIFKCWRGGNRKGLHARESFRAVLVA
jgi:hypothetical protein